MKNTSFIFCFFIMAHNTLQSTEQLSNFNTKLSVFKIENLQKTITIQNQLFTAYFFDGYKNKSSIAHEADTLICIIGYGGTTITFESLPTEFDITEMHKKYRKQTFTLCYNDFCIQLPTKQLSVSLFEDFYNQALQIQELLKEHDYGIE